MTWERDRLNQSEEEKRVIRKRNRTDSSRNVEVEAERYMPLDLRFTCHD